MTVTSIFASISLLLFLLIFGGFMLLRPPKCPRCGGREWVPMPRFGKFAAYCKHCLKQVDMANWRKE